MSKSLIAVYGSLRKGLGNYKTFLKNAEYLGDFDSEPVYSLYNLTAYPGLKENGSTSIKMEVYEVSPEEESKIDRLEGYAKNGNNSFYDKREINTPFGKASIYIYIPEVKYSQLIESGDWKEFYDSRLAYN